jgi:hypothetical protein
MGTEPKPFTIQPMLVLQGGHLKKYMLLSCDFVDNTPFTCLKKTNRQLACALGMTGEKRSPFAGCDLFEKLQQLRNDKVDEHIKGRMISGDPLSDGCDFNIQPSQRHQLFMDCKVPQVVEIELHQFVSAEGKHVGPHKLNVISTWNKIIAPSVEATGPNMEWLLIACRHEWLPKPSSSKRKNIDEDLTMKLPTLPDPLKYAISSKGVVRIQLYYKCSNGWKRHEKKLDNDLFDDGGLEDTHHMIMAVAAKMLKFYQDPHTPSAELEHEAQDGVGGEDEVEEDIDDELAA